MKQIKHPTGKLCFYHGLNLTHNFRNCAAMKNDPKYTDDQKNLLVSELLRPKFIWFKHSKVYFKVILSMYGHPVSGRLLNKLFFKTIESAGYYEDPIIPAIIKHKTLPTVGGLVVDDCGLKIRCKEHALHIIEAVEKVWKVKVNWNGNKFLGLNIEWDYDPINPTAKISNTTAIPDSQKRFYSNQSLKGCETPEIYTHFN